MLALRDQENLVHVQQTTAAAKPLNQGLRQLQPKTPGTRAPKTPFKVPLNDENDPLAFGKKTVKGNGLRNENTLKPAKDAFVTPLGPRNRAPLGMKTTNAKAKGFQTPAPPGDTVKPEKTNRKSSTAQKVKKAAPVVQPSRTELLSKLKEDEVPDVEYAPPKPKELPDHPDDIIYDTTFPQFKGRNIARGWEKVYFHGEVGEDGLTQRERKFKEESIAYDKLVDEMILKQVENMELRGINIREDPDEPCWEEIQQQRREEQSAKENGKKTRARSVSTIKSREAAAALSQSSASRLNTVKSSTTSQSRKASSLIASRKKTPTPTNASSMRHAAATARSRTTLGYARGRSVSSRLQGKTTKAKEDKPASKSILAPEKYIELYGPPPVGSEMWTRCKEAGCLVNEEENTEDKVEEELPIYEEDEETRNFQLTL
ncbi:hypothetical protein VTN77DRAFT_1723 [Rasamsonia byssochlamydoides]|uniref:uncharacterized protein n=1 Tax=Rasamsonia byssochlamydoides TaxID=89139 RepID=UPI003743CA53